MQLKVGDRVDGVYGCTVSSHKFYHWMPGTVVMILDPSKDQDSQMNAPNYNDAASSVLNKKFKVKFDGFEMKDGCKFMNLVSFDLAPPNTFTDDFAWRKDLKEGDLVDCLDTEHMWYRSTILETREVKDDPESLDPPNKDLFIAYRVYEEEGHKVDERDSRKFTGWSFRYDAWMAANTCLVQRIGTLARHYTVAGKSTMVYEGSVADESDTIFNSSKIK